MFHSLLHRIHRCVDTNLSQKLKLIYLKVRNNEIILLEEQNKLKECRMMMTEQQKSLTKVTTITQKSKINTQRDSREARGSM